MFESLSTLYWSQCYIMHVAMDHLHVSKLKGLKGLKVKMTMLSC